MGDEQEVKTVESITWTQSGTATSATKTGQGKTKAGVWDVCVWGGAVGGAGGGTKSEDCILQNPLPSSRRGPASAMNNNNNNNKGGGVSRLNSSHIPSS